MVPMTRGELLRAGDAVSVPYGFLPCAGGSGYSAVDGGRAVPWCSPALYHRFPRVPSDMLSRATRVRRNHALEHAAITIVTERHPAVFLRGRSNSRGFYIFGEIDTEELRSAIDEALRRLNAGESELAIHPRCGTNLAVAGILSGLSAAMASQLRPRHNRFSYAILASLGALLVSPRIGTATQRKFTTLAAPADLQVLGIERKRLHFMRESAHWVRTQST
jgi:hypothetical protein